MLLWTLYISIAGAALTLILPRERANWARVVALVSAITGAAIAVASAILHRPTDQLVTLLRLPWIPSLGIEIHFAADGISLTLCLLTAVAALTGILFSWNITHRPKEFFALYLVLIAGVYGVFLSFDLFLLFLFYEIAIVPKYFLIAIWGSSGREYAAMKLALYSFAGSAAVLIGLIATFVIAGGTTFNLLELAQFTFPPAFQAWAFPTVFIGFALLAGLWPLHTWAPTGHVAAPTAASMLLAGVVMKLGAYGALRVAMTLFPQGLEMWRETIAVLAAIGIVYGALAALTQRDLKFVIGYSSVSHMGFVLLGLMTLSEIGLSGAVLQMFSHGVIAGLLFAIVGRMIYARTHTRDLSALGELHLGQRLPFAAVLFVLATMAGMGMPGFSGFIAELHILIGAWQSFPTLALVAGLGIAITVAYALRAVVQAFFHANPSTSKTPADSPSPNFEPITTPEKFGALILVSLMVVVGIYPQLLLDIINPALNSPLLQPIWKGVHP